MSASILVVEDNPDNMKFMIWSLEDEGYKVEGVSSGEAALNMLNVREFDLILMDISLAGMDGKEATRRIRIQDRFADLPIIAVTAHAIKGEDQAILNSGVSALVTKPIDEKQLWGIVRAHLMEGATNR